jgi:integrase
MEFIARPNRGLPVVVQTYLTAEQVAEIREWLSQQDNLQLTTYFELSFDTMARVNAISSIKWEQIDFENFIIEDVLEKEQRLVTLYFGENTRDVLLSLKAEREKDGIKSPFVFITRDGNQIGVNTLRDWCTKIGLSIGVETLHPHDFRHSSATLRKNAGMTLEDVSSFLNHSSTEITRTRYLKEDKSQLSQTFKSIKI